MSWIISRPQWIANSHLFDNWWKFTTDLIDRIQMFPKNASHAWRDNHFPDLRLAAILLTRSGLRVAAPWLLRVRRGGPGLLTVVTSCVRRKIFLLKSSSYYWIIPSLKFSLPCGSSQMSQKNLTSQIVFERWSYCSVMKTRIEKWKNYIIPSPERLLSLVPIIYNITLPYYHNYSNTVHN